MLTDDWLKVHNAQKLEIKKSSFTNGISLAYVLENQYCCANPTSILHMQCKTNTLQLFSIAMPIWVMNYQTISDLGEECM